MTRGKGEGATPFIFHPLENFNLNAYISYLLLPKKKKNYQSSHCDSLETNMTSIHEKAGSIPGLAQWVKDLALP